MEDIKICVESDCKQEFKISEGFKKLLDANPGLEPPKRCYSCRQRRKRQTYEENE